MRYSHPEGLKCPRRARGTKSARILRRNGRSHVSVYRCRHCQQVYTVYSGTVFQGKHLRPPQVILLLRGRCKGEPSAVLVRELGLSRPTVHMLRRAIGQNARRLQPDTALEDSQTQTDGLFVNAGEKGEKHTHPADPARRRGNRRRAHGTYAHDRPPVIGTVGRHSGRVRLRVVGQRRREVLEGHVCRFTPTEAVVFTDEWQGYEHIVRVHHTVQHGKREWARDADADGRREVHVSTCEGLWTRVCHFLRSFRGVHKKYLAEYVAICEFGINMKRISPAFISGLVKLHHS